MTIQSLDGWVGSLFGNLIGRARNAISRWNAMQRLDSCEIEAIARELNVSVAELGLLISKPSSSVQPLRRRLVHAGIVEDELAASHGDVLRDLCRVCSLCVVKARCARDVGRERRATPSKYCPNEQTLRALSDQASGRPSAKILPFPARRD